MTKDELLKRLVRIEASPLKNIPPPRETIRRELNTNVGSDDSEGDSLDNFFDFQKEIDEVQPARVQVEKVSQIEEPPPEGPESFFVLDESELDGRSGNPESFFIFDEGDEERTAEALREENLEVIETTITISNMEEVSEGDLLPRESLEKLEGDNQVNLEVILDKNLEPEKSLVNNFKLCKYVKDGGEPCKRQAPKNGEYCSSHRKLLAKQSEK